jgi:uncharacterized protein with PIN domain
MDKIEELMNDYERIREGFAKKEREILIKTMAEQITKNSHNINKLLIKINDLEKQVTELKKT